MSVEGFSVLNGTLASPILLITFVDTEGAPALDEVS